MDNSCYIRTAQQLGFDVPSSKFTDSDESIGGCCVFCVRCAEGFWFRQHQ